jgi:hypothetical protein
MSGNPNDHFNFRQLRTDAGLPTASERRKAAAMLAACADKPVRRIRHSSDLPTLAPAILTSGKYRARP